MAYVCKKKLKVRLNVSVPFLLIWRGGGERAANGGVSEDPASNFYACFGGRRAIRRGGGGHRQTNPLPPGCNHHRNIHHTRSYRIKNIFLEYPVLSIVCTRALGG
jgi:hypothetical protein